MDTVAHLKEEFDQLQHAGSNAWLTGTRQHAFHAFNRLGIPTTRNEEWKYTRIGGLFNTTYRFGVNTPEAVTGAIFNTLRLPGADEANELVFINGQYSALHSVVRSAALQVQPLEEASGNQFAAIVREHFNHSSHYAKDGINALNTAMVQGGIFLYVARGRQVEHPVYLYNITDARLTPVLSQPRSLIYISEGATVELVETYATLGLEESFTNQVIEIVAAEAAQVAYYKIQQDAAHASLVSTTHIRQIGKSVVNTATISLNGKIVRNNLNVLLEAQHAEAHLYGLYFQTGAAHIDNHTFVDHVAPNCLSNELYKGVLDDKSTGVFNGKIFVRPHAQKTNAFQSNKNVLLSDAASINSKPQLEIYADDVKCSHGCTVGRLDEEGLFYLQSRGIPEKVAQSLLLQGFAMDVLEKIKPGPVRNYVDHLIAERLTF